MVGRLNSLRYRVLVCHAADTASLATLILFGKRFSVATLVDFGEKRCRKNLPLYFPDAINRWHDRGVHDELAMEISVLSFLAHHIGHNFSYSGSKLIDSKKCETLAHHSKITGRSTFWIEIQPTFRSNRLPQFWSSDLPQSSET